MIQAAQAKPGPSGCLVLCFLLLFRVAPSGGAHGAS